MIYIELFIKYSKRNIYLKNNNEIIGTRRSLCANVCTKHFQVSLYLLNTEHFIIIY